MADLCALVPLDTTPASESALQLLPLVKEMGFSKVRLVSVANRSKGANKDTLGGYLEKHASKVTALGLGCETRVLEGDPVDVILAEAANTDVDLILIATHGRTGLARMRLGSVGEKLIKNASCPRLVVGPNVEIDLATYDLTRVLVPLDGSPLSELSIPIARHIARACEAEVTLIRAVSPTPVTGGEGMVVVDTLGAMRDDAELYLRDAATKFQGLKVSASVVLGRPAEAVIDFMKDGANDLVVLASNGRTGFTRAIMGSTAERILHGPDPVLIFEPGEDRSRFFQAARAAEA